VEYTSHRDAALARRKLVPGKVFLFDMEVQRVDWAEPEIDIDEETMAQVLEFILSSILVASDFSDGIFQLKVKFVQMERSCSGMLRCALPGLNHSFRTSTWP
jgi:hypothetical protein